MGQDGLALIKKVESSEFGARNMADIVTSADGIRIAYEAYGEVTPALVSVHGWLCDRSYWKEQAQPFSRQFKVVAVDLAGRTLQELKLPVVAINPDYPPTDIASMECYRIEVVFMSGAGHFLMMEDPERFNTLLRTVIDKFVR